MAKAAPPDSPAFVVDEPTPTDRRFAALEASEGASVLPTDGAVSRGGTPVTQIEACAAYLLSFHPHRWCVMGGKVIPAFKKIKFIKGLNGVDYSATTKTLRVSPARMAAEDRGEVVIPFGAIPRAHVGRADLHQTPGAPSSYLWQPVGRPDVNLLIYERCYPGSAQITCDEANYIAFCEALRDEHHLIGHPPVFVLQKLLEDATKRAGEIADQASRMPHLATAAKAAQNVVDVIAAALESRQAEVAARATPSTGAASAPTVL